MLNLNASASIVEQEAGVTMRLIGHEILLSAGDKTSKVLPVKREGNRFQISFENEFAFDPGLLVFKIDSIMMATEFSKNYIVEIQPCNQSEIVHSYQMSEDNPGVIPCSDRTQPKACYYLYFTDLDGTFYVDNPLEHQSNAFFIWFLPLLLAAGTWVYFRKKAKQKLPEHIITLGEYHFDEKAMIIKRNGTETELTGKEVDLLLLLHNSNNETIERETILNKVWGDEGDYVGRTLDVFISKLRKKLELDPNVKIANVRGVGYKLILPD